MKYRIEASYGDKVFTQYAFDLKKAMDIFNQWQHTQGCEWCKVIDIKTETTILNWKGDK
jgi:sarcosine oxidase delta subunit